MFFLSIGIFFSCHNTIEEIDKTELEENLPLQIIENGSFTYTEKGRLINKLSAGKFLQFKNQDIEVKEGMWMEIYDRKENVAATITSQEGTYDQTNNILVARKDVVLTNQEGDSLFSQELHLYQDSNLIISKVPIEIRRGKNVIFGDGLRANTSFSQYEINNPAKSRLVIPEDSLESKSEP